MLLMRPDTQDEMAVKEVLTHNQYELPKQIHGTVVDVGAHIGAFALACLERGADQVVCFEPDAENFRFLKSNLSGYQSKVALVNSPVWRSDKNENVGFNGGGSNTACGSVEPRGGDIRTVGLNDIIDRYGNISLLKIDAEASEYPILYTCSRLGQVGSIVGESHRVVRSPGAAVCGIPLEFFSIEGLALFLKCHGFSVRSKWENDRNYVNKLFWATRHSVQF